MGWTANFVLVRDGEPGEVAARLGGRLAAEELTFEEALDEAPGPAIGPLLDGWRVVVDRHSQLVDDERLADLSAGGHVVRYGVVEGAGFAMASAWRDRSEQWSLTYEDGRLTVRGDPPAPDPAASDVDGFDAVLAAVETVTGWAYDGDDATYRAVVAGDTEPLIDVVNSGLAERLAALGFARQGRREYDLELAAGRRGYLRIEARTAVDGLIESVTLQPSLGIRAVGWQWLTALDPDGRVRPRPSVPAVVSGRGRGLEWRVYRPWPLPRRHRRHLRRERWGDRFPYGPVGPVLDDLAGAVARGGLAYLHRLAGEEPR